MWHEGALILVIALGVLTTAEASAQERAAERPANGVVPPDVVPAPDDAFELQFNAGYVQPFGELSDTVDMGDIADAGFTGGGALAWRLTPRYALVGHGGWGHWVGDDRLNDGKAFGGAGGLAASFHLQPYSRVDPVLQLGAGYRLFFVAPGDERDNHMLHGFQVLKVDLVIDIRATEDFAIGPMISADVNILPWDLNTSTGDNAAIDEPSLNTFFFAGVAGRHDILGARETPESRKPVAAARAIHGR
jgi:hypothetical protein